MVLMRRLLLLLYMIGLYSGGLSIVGGDDIHSTMIAKVQDTLFAGNTGSIAYALRTVHWTWSDCSKQNAYDILNWFSLEWKLGLCPFVEFRDTDSAKRRPDVECKQSV